MSEDFNQPYAPPPQVEDEFFNGQDGYLREPQAVPAGNATSWISNSWLLFKAQPLKWILATVLYFVVSIVLSFIPYLGSFAQSFLGIFLGAGFVYAAARIEEQGDFEIGDIFAGFRENLNGLLILSAIAVGFTLAIALGSLAVGFPMYSDPDPQSMQNISWAAVGVFMVIIFVLSIVYAAATYLAPTLVLLQNEPPMEAIKLSLAAFKNNILGAILCSLLMIILMIVAAIPLGLGLLVVMPMFLVIPYVIYRDLFFAE